MADVDITIIGAGAVGSAIAYQFSNNLEKQLCEGLLYREDWRFQFSTLGYPSIALLDKMPKFKGENQSSRNSGVIHTPINYPKITMPLKARLCYEGNRLLYEFCKQNAIPCKKTGKLVVTTNAQEKEYLDDVLRVALENGENARRLNRAEAARFEPNVKAKAAVYIPNSGIIDPVAYVNKLQQLAGDKEVNMVSGHEVIGIEANHCIYGNVFRITTLCQGKTESFTTHFLINAAGLYSDAIAKMVNPNSKYEMDPIRGESARFNKMKKLCTQMAGMNVYPAPYGILPNGDKVGVPFSQFQDLLKSKQISKTVGVHLTPTFDLDGKIGSTVTIGPASVGGVGKEDYRQTRNEQYYLDQIKSFFPALELEDIELHQAGIRAKLKDHSDFVIESDPKYKSCINVLGIDSPGLTCSLAIAKHVVDLLPTYELKRLYALKSDQKYGWCP